MTAFQIADCRTLGETQRWITSHAWSPIVWNNGHRLEANFLFSDFCALDFDDGRMTIDMAREMLIKGDYAGIIGTTKSHQKEKGGLTCDRFRIVIPWAGRISDVGAYKQNMKRLTEHLPADRAAKDAARFFWPCSEIVFYRPGGKMAWLPYTAPRPRTLPSKQAQEAMFMSPGFYSKIKSAAIEGNRNDLAYWATKRMKEAGFRQVDVENILGSYISLDAIELNRTISSAFKSQK